LARSESAIREHDNDDLEGKSLLLKVLLKRGPAISRPSV
jgi:hypothetical protein